MALWEDPGYRERMTHIHTELWEVPEFREMMSRAQIPSALKRWQNPTYRERQIEAAKQRWIDPEYVRKMAEAVNAKPNKLEQRIITICAKHAPDFQWNGDFSLGVMIAGLVPDLVNVNGKKQVIEVLGDYFHSPKVMGDRWQGYELGKLMLYNSVGYRCLVLWEHEINGMSDEQIAQKVKTFSQARTK